MNKRRLNPLGRKIVAAILGTTMLSLLLALLLNIFPMVHTYRQAAVDKAVSLADLVANSLGPAIDFNDVDSADEDLHSLSLIPSVTGAAVYLEGGHLFASYGVVPTLPKQGNPAVRTRFSSLTVVTVIPSVSSGNQLVITISLDDQWSMLKGNFLVGVLISLGVFFFSSRLAGHFRRKLAGPLTQLTRVVSDISLERDYSRRVHYDSDDEIGVLVTEFNSMLQKIQERDARLDRHREHLEYQVEQRTMQLQLKQDELVRNNQLLLKEIRNRIQAEMIREEVERINRHDLKSGLSLVIGYPELLLRNGGLDREQEKMVRRIRAAGYRMLDMIRNHLNMFMMEKGIYSLRQERVDLVELVCGLEEEFAPLLKSLGISLSIDLDGCQVVGDEEFSVTGDTMLIRAMLRNLMQNAVEASKAGDTVGVEMTDGVKKRIAVINPGEVDATVRRRFFEKYVTHGKENGTGLGTYFAALIARTHGADITMKTSGVDGTSVTVLFRTDREPKVSDSPDQASLSG
ncbi:ATP-binding protein [Pseudodesulfovibrio piezophilus]|uniref:histidine kinase n=1 Tax=Pseudodesulfovibrio piezophilus (strain DSM 21447 / JCM 15486 / C1TLV30) TaxID=1322246 RepID=M1WX48_PSEP2|nr:ATP-binding protein [Pseudodesulfovibrio piezophilus]CCH49508.1 Histidine kinase [Pseudodesulfovibrio piezophilus C1TLV30]